MTHFSIDEWADFVRDVTLGHKRGGMQQHLDSGCRECLKTANIWRTVMELSQLERMSEPPASATKVASAYFGLVQQAFIAPGGIEIAKLAFDSFQRELTGERGAAAHMARQLLFKCGSFCVDVRLEPKPGSDQVVLLGQVIDAEKPLKGFGQVPVSLLSSGDKVSETMTNQFGEFNFAFQALRQVQLFFGMKQRALVVPLPQAQPVAA